MPTQEFLADQRHLTGSLQLLKGVGYSDLYLPYVHDQFLPPSLKPEFDMLNTIAALLTSGRPGDTTAAFFDEDHGSLLLAKNRAPTIQDVETTRSLISALLSPSTYSAADLSDYLLLHCRENMQKRVFALHQSLIDFYLLPAAPSEPTDFEDTFAFYHSKSLQQEFPKSAKYKSGTHNVSLRDVLGGLFERCIEESKLDLDPTDPTNAMSRFHKLCRTAGSLLHSRFLNVLTFVEPRASFITFRDWEQRARKLKRRLAKVYLYHGGVNKLIKAAKRRFRDDIPFHWVDDPIPESGEGEIYLDAGDLRRLWEKNGSKAMTMLSTKFPNLTSSWEKNRPHVDATVHAEIRIILYILQRQNPASRSQKLLIGCSKPSCLCCALWICHLNSHFQMGWIVDRSPGKPSCNWALPGNVGDKFDEDGRDLSHIEVFNSVVWRLWHTLQLLLSDDA